MFLCVLPVPVDHKLDIDRESLPVSLQVLLALLSVKMPITDADLIRSMACKALVGLSRCSAIRQIISKLPLFSSGHIQQVEPHLTARLTLRPAG